MIALLEITHYMDGLDYDYTTSYHHTMASDMSNASRLYLQNTHKRVGRGGQLDKYQCHASQRGTGAVTLSHCHVRLDAVYVNVILVMNVIRRGSRGLSPCIVC